MALMGISQRDYAAYLGMSRGAVQRMYESGKLVLHPDKSINVRASDLLREQLIDTSKSHPRETVAPSRGNAGTSRDNAAPSRATAAPPLDPPAPNGMKRVPDAAVNSVREALGEPVDANAVIGQTAGQGTFLKARTANEILKAQERTMRLQKMRGELVDKAKAVALVFRIGRDIRDAWLNWPARISAEFAAEIGVDPQTLNSALERYVRSHLSELAEVKPNFR